VTAPSDGAGSAGLEVAFTPGPIRIEPQGDGARGYWLHDDNGDYVAMVCKRDANRAEEEGNAALYAAAPDLYTVMSEVLPYLEEGYMEDEDDEEPIGWCSDADGSNQRPVALTFGMIRRFRAALSRAGKSS
jgi:hypothetical protein